MIENILKLRDGKRISRNEYAAVKQKFEDLYKNADSDTKAKVDGLLMSGNNYSSANPMNNRSAREFSTNLYNHAINMLENPELNYSVAPSPSVSTANLFNGYSHAENSNNADYVAYRYLNQNNLSSTPREKTSSTPSTMTNTPTTSGTKYYRYNWADGIPWTRETDTLELRTTNFAEALKSNIESALNSGKNIVGADKNKLLQALNMLTAWNGDFGQLMRIAQLANVDKSQFDSYFGELFPGMNKSDKAKKKLIDDGYEFVEGGDYGHYMNQLISDNLYRVAKKGNKYYLISNDWSGPVTGAAQAYINTDWRDANHGFGAIIGNDGSFIFGDMTLHYDNEQSPYYIPLNNYLKTLNNENRWLGNTHKFSKYTSISDHNLVNTFADQLDNKNIADVSSYFDGADVIATVEGNDFNTFTSKFGHLKLDDPRFTFYYKDKSGNFKSGNLSQISQDLGNITLNSKSKARNFQNFKSTDVNLDGLNWAGEEAMNDFDINGRGDWHNWWTPNREMVNEWNGEKTSSDTSIMGHNDGTYNNKGKFARLMLYAFVNRGNLDSNDKVQRELIRTVDAWTENNERKQNLLYVIYSAMKEDPESFSDPRYRDAFLKLQLSLAGALRTMPNSTEVTELKKEGGILKAATGAGIDINGNPISLDPKESIAGRMRDEVNKDNRAKNALIERAEENGRDIHRQRAPELNRWTTSDTFRATALATDVAGLIAAVAGPATSGVGSAVAIGSGFLSMLQDAVADFTDDKVSTGQTLTNIGINTGLAATAFLGSKAPKILKSATKILPKILMTASTAGVILDPEVQKTADKVMSGKSLNTNDWRNLTIILRLATGFGTVGTLKYKQNKGQEIYNEEVNKNLKKLITDSELSDDIKYISNEDGTSVIPIKKGEFEAAQKALKNKDIEGAKAALIGTDENPGSFHPSKNNEVSVDDVVLTIAGEKKGIGKLAFWKDKPEDTYVIKSATPEQVANSKIAPDIAADARLSAIESLRRKAQKSHKLKFLNKLEGRDWVQSVNPVLGAALNDAQARGKNYKNIRDLIAGENEEIGPYRPSRMGEVFTIDDDEITNINRAVHDAVHSDVDVLASAVENKRAYDSVKLREKQLGKLNKQQENAVKKLESADAEVATAQQELEAAQAALASAKKPSAKLGLRLKKAKQEYDIAVKDRQAAEDAFVKAYEDLNHTHVTDRSGLDIKARNDAFAAEFQAKKDALVQAQAVLDSMMQDPKYSNWFTKRGKLNKNMARNKAGARPILEAIQALEKAESDLATFLKKNRIVEPQLWDIFLQRRQEFLQQHDRVNNISGRISSLNSRLNANTPEIRARKAGVKTALLKHDQNVSVAENTRKLIEGLRNSAEKKETQIAEAKNTYEEQKKQLREKLNIAQIREHASRGRSLGKTSKSVTVKSEGQNIVIAKGTETRSYTHVRDHVTAESAATQNLSNVKILSKEDIAKIYPSNVRLNIRGAAIGTNTSGNQELVIWQQGGKINEKYSHLR